MNKKKIYIMLNILLFFFSLCGVFSKLAAGEAFLSLKFCIFYFINICIMGLYAIFWQQIIKYVPLTVAYANRAVTVVWGCVWGMLLFQEKLTLKKVFGIIILLLGIILYSVASVDKGQENG